MSEVLTSLTMPLRDVVRTVRAASLAAEPILRPSARFLPPPLQHLVEDAARRADDLGDRVLDLGLPTDAEIAAARRAASTAAPPIEAQADLVRALVRAITEAMRRRERRDWIVAESRLALLVGRVTATAPAAGDLHAGLARLGVAILASHAVTTLGRAVPPRPAAQDPSVRVAVFAALLWLSLDREGPQDEAHLMRLALDVASLRGDEIERAAGSRDATGALLRRLSGVI